MQEIWKDIKDYEGLYQASNLGKVKRTNSNEVKKQQKDRYGYFYVTLFKNGIRSNKWVARLVAETFIDNPNNFEQVNHKDEDISNNRIDNLEWCTNKYNVNYGTHNKKVSNSLLNNPKKSKRILCVNDGNIYLSSRDVERKLGINHSQVLRVCHCKKKQTHNLNFKFVD